MRKTPAGHHAVQVYPNNIKEKIFAGGMRAELYIESGACEQQNPLELPAGLVGILGAGNFDAPTDVLHALFLQVVVLVILHDASLAMNFISSLNFKMT